VEAGRGVILGGGRRRRGGSFKVGWVGQGPEMEVMVIVFFEGAWEGKVFQLWD